MILGITGHIESGKDTFADVLVEAGWVKVGFMDAMKEDLAVLLGVSAAYIEAHKDELRLTMQLRGTEFWRARDPMHWIREAERRVNVQLCAGRNVVIPGVRYLNEAEWVRKKGGTIVRLIRAEDEVTTTNGHASETEQDLIKADTTHVCASADEVRTRAREFLEWCKRDCLS